MSTAIAKKPLRQVQNVKELLYNDQARDQLAAVAARHLSPERMMRVVNNAIRTTPKLAECDPLSFLGALMQCASLGLEPQTVLGHAYLVPFRNNKKGITEVQVIVGYKGLIDLARRSGHITSIAAHVHYSDDELWDYEEGTDARLRHRPGNQEGEKLHAYAIARFKDGGFAYVVLPWAHVMKIRNGSQGWQTAVKYKSTDKNPWSTHEDAMAKKTAIRALAKYLPLSVEFMDAVTIDHDQGQRVDFASHAMNPADGPTIDGDYIDGEAEHVAGEDHPEQAPEENPKAKEPEKKPAAKKAEPKPDPKKAEADKAEEQKPAPKEDESEDEDEGGPVGPSDDEMANKILEILRDNLADAANHGEVEEVMEMFAQEIDRAGCQDAANEAADARREELAA